MALPTSGPLSFSMIRDELGVTYASLRDMSAIVGLVTPDNVSEFYGYIAGPPVSDIVVNRSSDNNGGFVRIEYTSLPQQFQDSYIINQDFAVQYFDYQYNYSYQNIYTYQFAFNDTNLNSERFEPHPSQFNSFVQYSYPIGNPILYDIGLPVNITGWS